MVCVGWWFVFVGVGWWWWLVLVLFLWLRVGYFVGSVVGSVIGSVGFDVVSDGSAGGDSVDGADGVDERAMVCVDWWFMFVGVGCWLVLVLFLWLRVEILWYLSTFTTTFVERFHFCLAIESKVQF